MNRRTAQKFLIYKGVQDERELKENIEIVTNSKRLIFSIFRIFPKIGFLILNYKTNMAFLMSQTKNLQDALLRVTKHLFLAI